MSYFAVNQNSNLNLRSDYLFRFFILNIKEIHIDQQILLRLKSGDRKAFELIFNKYYNLIYSFSLNTLYDKIFAEDVAQVVFLTLWEKRENIDEQKNIVNFLYTIAKHNVYRQTERLLLKWKHEERVKETQPTSIDMEEDLNGKFLEDVLSEIMKELPEARRRIFIMSRKQHLNNREIAKKLSISEKTVETQIRRSLIFVKERMKQYLSLFFHFLFILILC